VVLAPQGRNRPTIGKQIPWKDLEGQLLRAIRFLPLVAFGQHVRRKHRSALAWAMMEVYGRDDPSRKGSPLRHHLDFRRSWYALLEVECPWVLSEPAYLPIRHRFDFLKLCVVFFPFQDTHVPDPGKEWLLPDEDFLPDEEILLCYPSLIDEPLRKVLRPFMPQLEVIIEPIGFLDWMFERRQSPPPGGWGWRWRPDWSRE
jgi:hypothetical protein